MEYLQERPIVIFLRVPYISSKRRQRAERLNTAIFIPAHDASRRYPRNPLAKLEGTATASKVASLLCAYYDDAAKSSPDGRNMILLDEMPTLITLPKDANTISKDIGYAQC